MLVKSGRWVMLVKERESGDARKERELGEARQERELGFARKKCEWGDARYAAPCQVDLLFSLLLCAR